MNRVLQPLLAASWGAKLVKFTPETSEEILVNFHRKEGAPLFL